jgi:proteasome assembly chaperone (PAC2) family protein
VGRPVTDIEGGLVKALSRPTTTFWFYKTKGSAHDLVLMLGREPELRWGDYVSLILDLAQDFGVVRIYTIGGTYDVVPHTIEPLLGVVLSDSSLEAEMRGYGVQPINYKGPSSVHTTLLVSASEKHIEMVSLWGYVPHYVQVPNTKVCYRVLSELARMLDIALDLDDIRQQSAQLDDMIDKAISQKPELQDYVRRLEAEYSQGRYEAGETLKEDIIKDIEDFLRKRGDE